MVEVKVIFILSTIFGLIIWIPLALYLYYQNIKKIVCIIEF